MLVDGDSEVVFQTLLNGPVHLLEEVRIDGIGSLFGAVLHPSRRDTYALESGFGNALEISFGHGGIVTIYGVGIHISIHVEPSTQTLVPFEGNSRLCRSLYLGVEHGDYLGGIPIKIQHQISMCRIGIFILLRTGSILFRTEHDTNLQMVCAIEEGDTAILHTHLKVEMIAIGLGGNYIAHGHVGSGVGLAADGDGAVFVEVDYAATTVLRGIPSAGKRWFLGFAGGAANQQRYREE